MPRSTTVTVLASAVTLACLAASFHASPPVVAETMGRQIDTFSPLEPQTSPVASTSQEAADPAPSPTAERDYSIAGDATFHKASPDPAPEPAPRQVDQVPLSPVAPDDTETKSQDSDDDAATADASSAEPTAEASVEATAEAEPEVPEDLDSPESITVIVNKLRPLPADYEPSDLVELPAEVGTETHLLREEAAEALEAMFEAAQEDDIRLTVISGYRSYAYQTELYDNYVQQYGVAATNQMSARPGYSEHQTGLALDVDTPDGEHTLKRSFGETDAGQWLAEHAHEFGFVIRYPEDAQDYTGFQYEPWHLRYFGEPYAQHLAEGSGVAEREFELAPAPDYEE